MWIYIYIYIYMREREILSYMCVYIHIYVYVYTHVYIYIYIHIDIYTFKSTEALEQRHIAESRGRPCAQSSEAVASVSLIMKPTIATH